MSIRPPEGRLREGQKSCGPETESSERKTNMDITEEALMNEAYGTDEEEILAEAWPMPKEVIAREFKDYLEEIGLRF